MPLLLVSIFQDVGKLILESYSRVLESLASNIVTRIDDLLNIDELNISQQQVMQTARLLAARLLFHPSQCQPLAHHS